MRRRALAFTLFLILAAGLLAACSQSGGGETPVTVPDAGTGAGPSGGGPEPAADGSSALIAAVKVTQTDAGSGAYVSSGAELLVGTGPITMAISFRGAVDRQEVESRLEVSPPGVQPKRSWQGSDLLLLDFPAGADGEEVRVLLRQGIPIPIGGETAADLAYTFRRARPAGLSLKLDGQPLPWPVPGRTYLPVSGDVKLELLFDKPVDQASVTAAIQAAAARGGTRAALQWEGDLKLVATLSGSSGSQIQLDLGGAVDRDGIAITVAGPPAALRWGRTGVIAAVPISGGAGREVLTAPHDIIGAVGAAGGKRIAYLEDTGREGAFRVWMAEENGANRWDTGLYVTGVQRLAWLGDRRLLVADEAGLWLADAASRSVERLSTGPVDGLAASGDGRLAAWLQARSGTGGHLVFDVIYRESSQGRTARSNGVLQRERAGATGRPQVMMALSPDAGWLAIGDTPSPVPGVVLLKTDGSYTWEMPVPRRVNQGPLAYSPGGTLLVSGGVVMDTETGDQLAELPGARLAAWAPGSNRVAYSGVVEGKPEQVWVMDLGSGARRSLGNGQVVGWQGNNQVLLLRP